MTPRRPLPAAALLAAIEGWREQLAEVLASPDPERAVEHLDKGMEQAAVIIAELIRDESPD